MPAPITTMSCSKCIDQTITESTMLVLLDLNAWGSATSVATEKLARRRYTTILNGYTDPVQGHLTTSGERCLFG